MSRLSPSIAGLIAVVALAAACPSEPVRSTCVLEQHQITASPLTLLPDARIDRVGDGLVLLGTDGSNVLWASLDFDGTLGPEHTYQIPPHSGRPLLAVAGAHAPEDRLIIAFLPSGGPAVGLTDLMTISVGFDNTMPTLPASSGAIPVGATITMRSGRGGMHAGVAWGVPGTTQITARILNGDGHTVQPDLSLGMVGDFECLQFLPGRSDLTIGYVDLTGSPAPMPTFFGFEIDDTGVIGVAGPGESSFKLQVGKEVPGCVQMVSTDRGCGVGSLGPCYGLAWRLPGIATYFAVLDPVSLQAPSNPVLADVAVAGMPPDLGGLGWTGKDFALVFARETGAEVWPINALGQKQGEIPVFPSAVGHTGVVSTQPVGAALYATYADYADATSTAAGQRFLVKVSCP